MKCGSCGLLLNKGDKGCYNCGSVGASTVQPVIAFSELPVVQKTSAYSVASAQKLLIWSIVSSVLIVIPGVIFAVAIFQMVCLYRLAEALKKQYPVLWALAAFIPVGGLVLLLILNNDATGYLRKSGIRVGLLGADLGALR